MAEESPKAKGQAADWSEEDIEKMSSIESEDITQAKEAWQDWSDLEYKALLESDEYEPEEKQPE